MRIGITDSGVGGLSVCAELEARLRHSPLRENIEVLYLNAAIEDHYAYNSMPDRPTKLRAFDRFLSSVQQNYQLDLLYIACNTLSVLFEDPYFDHYRHIPIEGIVDTGTMEMRRAFESDADVTFVIFATPTTIEEAVYSSRLRGHGVPANRVIEQACPGLPDAISNDGSGQLASELLAGFIPAAFTKMNHRPNHVLAYLGCTHYGYQATRFEAVLDTLAAKATVLNPNNGAVDQILSRVDTTPGTGKLEIEFVARYVIPGVVIDSLSMYIGEKAPKTLSALVNATHFPELCGAL